MKPKKPLMLSLINAALTESLLDGVAMFRQRYGACLDVRIFATHDIEEETISVRTVTQSLQDADMVFLDIRGGGKAAGLCASILPHTHQPVALLIGGSPNMMALLRLESFSMKTIMERTSKRQGDRPPTALDITAVQRVLKVVETGGSFLPFGKLKHVRNWARMMRYWQHGGGENIQNLLAFAAREYLDIRLPKPAKPIEYPAYGIYAPLSGKSYASLAAYRQQVKWHHNQPTIGLLFYGGMHFSQSLVPAQAFCRRLQEMGMNVIPVYSTAGSNLKAIETCMSDSETPVDAIVYFQWFQLTTFSNVSSKASIDLLKRLNAPIFCACPMYGREIHRWQNSD